MDHADHVALIHDGVEGAGTTWADLGSGDGAFTLALADLLGPGATIYSVDRDADALRRQRAAVTARFPRVRLEQRVADFATPLSLPELDGVVMANSLHFEPDKILVLDLVISSLRPAGRLVLVEYDADVGNAWVPYPMSWDTWRGLAARVGLRDTRRIGWVPSRFLGAIYAAVSER